MGGTRRAYLAQGGVLATANDLGDYFRWIHTAHCATLDHLYRLGVTTVLAIGRVPDDRGSAYQAFNRQATLDLIDSPIRRSFYAEHQIRVSAAGNIRAMTVAVGIPDLAERFAELTNATAHASGPRLVYLFRGSWDTPSDEATLGYQLGLQLGRAATHAELVQAYYGFQLPQLTAYVGSGRPRQANLRPLFLSGNEDLYWSYVSPLRMGEQDWRHVIYDHLYTRRTHSARGYPNDPDSRAQLAANITAQDGHILGIGQWHPLGYWVPASSGADLSNEQQSQGHEG